ncbi:hypothetical protein RB12117 [Rhodopirellula baltica SH 1]|uniref:Uncharacterized protein n=1 Tax=Rhodopirellula baltica (strain DSM 10527 / NCIMB 13988 / SH1) TaxID=243090 RepID=Q7UJ55_RHOBA|nr:hypothetical protein RB12117 [Rhodopirellula baltica SH 1]
MQFFFRFLSFFIPVGISDGSRGLLRSSVPLENEPQKNSPSRRGQRPRRDGEWRRGGVSIGGAIAYRRLPSGIPTGMKTCANAWPPQAQTFRSPGERLDGSINQHSRKNRIHQARMSWMTWASSTPVNR